MVSVLLASIIRFDSCTTCVHVSMAISLLSVAVQKLMPLVGFAELKITTHLSSMLVNTLKQLLNSNLDAEIIMVYVIVLYSF